MESYEEGEVMSDLPVGAEYEGIVDAFCDYCSLRWRADEKAAHLDVIADEVARGALTARFGTLRAGDGHAQPLVLSVQREEPLTVAELRALGRAPMPWWGRFPAYLSAASVLLFRDGRVLHGLGQDWPGRRQAVGSLLDARGWPPPSDECDRDITVRVDERSRIQVVRVV